MSINSGIENSCVSFIMSENIQIVLGVAGAPRLASDSIVALRRHNAPKMSVLAAMGDIAEDFLSKLKISGRRARLRSSVNSPRASGVQPFRTYRTPPKESLEIISTQTRVFGGSVMRIFRVANRYS
jgi:hypothetical protein